jgi:hypothetical protein
MNASISNFFTQSRFSQQLKRFAAAFAVAFMLAAALPVRADLVDGVFSNQRVAIYWQGGDKFTTAENGGAANVTANQTWIDSWEIWTIYLYGDGSLAFRGPNGKYLRANNAGASALDVQGAAPGAWEKFWLEKRNPAIDDEWGIRSDANGNYVRAPGGTGSMITDSTSINSSSTFKLYWLDKHLGGFGSLNNKNIGLFAISNQRYVTAENGGAGNIMANRTALGAWESFTIYDQFNDGTVALKAVNGKYVSCTAAGTGILTPTAPTPGPWEKLIIVQLMDNTFALISWVSGKYVGLDGTATLIPQSSLRIPAEGRFRIAWKDVDLYAATKAFAGNFPGKVKYCTKGYLNTTPGQNWGILFHTEYVINNKLWFYEAFPKSGDPAFPQGYQHVWNGIILQSDSMIGGDCTVPYLQTGAYWQPPIPRTTRYQPVGVKVNTAAVTITDQQISYPANTVISTTHYSSFGTINLPIMVDLRNTSSQENMGWRWVLELGLSDGPERWAVDLGPSVGIFQPRYGMVGYHSGGSSPNFPNAWDDKRFFPKIQTLTPNQDRRFNGMAQP